MSVKPAYICIFVSDLEKSIHFYRDILGLTMIEERETERFKPFHFGSIVLGLEPIKEWMVSTQNKNPFLLQLTVDSIEELQGETQKLKRQGVTLTQEVSEHSFAYVSTFLDPDGNRIEIICLK